MIHCPQCNAWASVIDTRTMSDNTTRRRYRCANFHLFWTLEVAGDFGMKRGRTKK